MHSFIVQEMGRSHNRTDIAHPLYLAINPAFSHFNLRYTGKILPYVPISKHCQTASNPISSCSSKQWDILDLQDLGPWPSIYGLGPVFSNLVPELFYCFILSSSQSYSHSWRYIKGSACQIPE